MYPVKNHKYHRKAQHNYHLMSVVLLLPYEAYVIGSLQQSQSVVSTGC